MKLFLILLIAFLFALSATAQKHKFDRFSIAVMNVQTALPFGKFSGLLYKDLHPGFEAGIGFNWKTKPKHDWYQEFKVGYFFHRFVQHGIPVYTNFGYRYKASSKLSFQTSLGAGYMQSIPATSKFKLDQNGDYKNDIGIGRSQAMAIFSLGTSYTFNSSSAKPIRLFASYQQRLQMPFVKSYVPFLPYNSFMIGFIKPIKKK